MTFIIRPGFSNGKSLFVNSSTVFLNYRRNFLHTILLLTFAIVMIPVSCFASIHLSCQVEQGGASLMLYFLPVSDPYTVKAVNINSC